MDCNIETTITLGERVVRIEVSQQVEVTAISNAGGASVQRVVGADVAALARAMATMAADLSLGTR